MKDLEKMTDHDFWTCARPVCDRCDDYPCCYFADAAVVEDEARNWLGGHRADCGCSICKVIRFDWWASALS